MASLPLCLCLHLPGNKVRLPSSDTPGHTVKEGCPSPRESLPQSHSPKGADVTLMGSLLGGPISQGLEGTS
jgi:hypothetical protein